MGDIYPTVRGAAVQAASVFLDREASIQKACELIREAGRNNADVVVFPEGFVPAHPAWFHFLPVTSSTAAQLNLELFKNAVEVPSPAVEAVAKAAGDAKAVVILGVCELSTTAPGSMLNSQLFFSADGRYVGKHQKLIPTVGERIVHWGGWGDTLGVVDTPFGPASGLVCGENSNPLTTFALTAQGTRVHGMSWPPHMMRSMDMADQSLLTARQFALVSKAFVISACGVAGEDYIDRLGVPERDTEFLREGRAQGGSVIVAPDTHVIAGPLPGDKEDILYADMDLELWARLKLIQDYGGHYNRAEIFSLSINRDPAAYIEERSTGRVQPSTAELPHYLLPHASASPDNAALGQNPGHLPAAGPSHEGDASQ